MNTPQSFWQCRPDPPEEAWQDAIRHATPILGLSCKEQDIHSVLNQVLGEAQFGPKHWQLTPARRMYYRLKPFLPRWIIHLLKISNARVSKNDFPLGWPIEGRYAQFMWEVMRQLLNALSPLSLRIRHIWPEGYRYAFVLTHDIETSEGQKFIGKVIDLEEQLGFRSSVNFVPERYKIDQGLVSDLRRRGFEIGVHGLKHDGKLFFSEKTFRSRVESINRYMKEFEASGFRSPLTHRNPYWMQALEVEYDLSFFDTDPFEAMPGGCMSIWPYFIGHFVELPYTLTQDCTLGKVLGEKTPRLWLEKLAFIEEYWGLALLNTHPDYLKDRPVRELYAAFLRAVSEKDAYWHALPREAAGWWRSRTQTPPHQDDPNMTTSTVCMEGDQLSLTPQTFSLMHSIEF